MSQPVSNGMYKNTKTILVSLFVFYFAIGVSAVTKPSSDADMSSFSYVFYLYYDKGQLFADRDYQVKYDIISEKFVQGPPTPNAYKIDISNFKSEVVKSIVFDPTQGRAGFSAGKIQVKTPYIPDGQKAVFYNSQGQQLVTIFVMDGALCNDDGVCNSASGENQKTCPNDCKTPRTPTATVVPTVPLDEGFDMMTIIIYGVGGLGVAILAWFGWKWWKKRKEENFLPPPSAPPSPIDTSSLLPPLQ
ncbi:MAG: hypothetical protein A3F98_00785 [Candidatus Yanofskybacteria bacterium RIFCSPLOWO2_12_FULL_41_8]|nr:MAG: hypothetical protein A3F98_00785 [Candidatus Yanofskybacteria bacterium RIFCSPLOWO2_12_FULL_41_8]